MTLEALRDVLSSDYKGPRAVFSEVHVLKAILAIGAAGAVGRGRLGSLVGLGQGEVRTLIKRMKENDLILIQARGLPAKQEGRARVPDSKGEDTMVISRGGQVARDRRRVRSGPGQGGWPEREEGDRAARRGGQGRRGRSVHGSSSPRAVSSSRGRAATARRTALAGSGPRRGRQDQGRGTS